MTELLYVVRKHRAPNGALRLVIPHGFEVLHERVRKHRAPKGALRLQHLNVCDDQLGDVRKHRAPNGALRPSANVGGQALAARRSESTEHQKVH